MKNPFVLVFLYFGIIPGVLALEPGATIPRSLEDLPMSLPTENVTAQWPIEAGKPSNSVIRSNAERFVLQQVEFTGNTVYDSDELQSIIANYLGKAVSLLDLETLRVNLVGHYRQSGYINSGVIMPDQQIKNGSVRFHIVEGTLGTITLQGEAGLSGNYVLHRLKASTEEPFNQFTLLQHLQWLLNDPLIERLNGSLKPGLQPGVSDLDLRVTRRKPYEIYTTFDNFTPASVGAYTGRLDGTIRNLTGWGDALNLNLSYSEGLQGISSHFSLPIGASETRLNLTFQGNQAAIVESSLKSLNIENDFFHLSAGLSHPVYQSGQRQLTVEGSFAYRYTRNFILGMPISFAEGEEENGKAKVGVLRLLQDYQIKGVDHAVSLRSVFNFGIGILGSTQYPNQADSRFFSWLGQARVVKRLSERAGEFFWRGDIQLSEDSLLPLERFPVGGVYSVRGYRQNELVRDNGYAMALEYRYLLSVGGDKPEHAVKLVPFIDYGRGWNHRSPNTINHHPSTGKTLWALGIGLQWEWRQMQAEIYWAHAMTNPNTQIQDHDLQDDGLYFRVATRVL